MLIKQQLLDNGWGPGGWSFKQPETGWEAPFPKANTFKQQVENIRRHREANPRFQFSTDLVKISEELEAYTLSRWRQTYSERGLQKFLERPDNSLKKKSSEPTITSNPQRSLLGKAAGLAGIDSSVLEDWFGAGGKPVEPSMAVNRAFVCRDCPGNRKGNWRDTLTIVAAKTLRAYFAAKNEMKLETPYDKDLGLCKACGCVMVLKCHAPKVHILSNLSDEERAKMMELNPNCWITAETP